MSKVGFRIALLVVLLMSVFGVALNAMAQDQQGGCCRSAARQQIVGSLGK